MKGRCTRKDNEWRLTTDLQELYSIQQANYRKIPKKKKLKKARMGMICVVSKRNPNGNDKKS